MINKFFLYDNLIQKTEIYYKQREYHLALDLVNEAISLELPLSKQKKVEAYDLRGNIKTKLSYYLDSINDFNKAIELSFFSINKKHLEKTYFNRAHAKHGVKDFEGAIKELTKAIEIDPNDANLYFKRSIAKSKVGDIKGANEDKNKSDEINRSYM